MTRERKYHIAAISLMVAGLVGGGVSFGLSGIVFWVVCAVAAALILVGLYLGSSATREQQKRE
jgi:hypothetical protein